MRICVVSSGGGHLTEVMTLCNALEGFDIFYVINLRVDLPDNIKNRSIYITHSERDWKLLVNIFESYKILSRERPDVILSTGAGPAVPMALVGRYLFNCKIIYIETITSVTRPSLTGRIMYFLAHNFYYQWESLRKFFPKGQHRGTLL